MQRDALCGFVYCVEVRSATVALLVLLCLMPVAIGQTEGLGNTTSTPVAGVPHDYLVGLNEIVNPANGSVSIRIPQPYPHERNPNWPVYAFTYDSTMQVSKTPNWFVYSNGTNNVQEVNQLTYGPATLALYPPPLSFSSGTLQVCIQINQSSCEYHYCYFSNNYVVSDPSGGRHALGVQQSYPADQGDSGACSYFDLGADQLQGGDLHYKASLTPGSTGGGGGTLYVWDLHGNVPATTTFNCGNYYVNTASILLEDVNGNLCNTTGRTNALVKPVPDTVQTETLNFPSNLTFPVTVVGQGYGGLGCDPSLTKITPGVGGSGITVAKSVTLPETGETYTFQYDPTYQLLSKITYPTGATVTYTWSTIPNAEGVQYQPQLVQGEGALCALQYSWFAITKRVVSVGGVNTQEQDFAYQTNWPTQPSYKWTSKVTTVTTKDLVRGTQFNTVYTYSPMLPPQSSYPVWVDLGYMPVESTIQYKDTNNNLLKTDTKVWASIDLMTAECETLPNGQTSGRFYPAGTGYLPYAPSGWTSWGEGGSTDLPADVAEYDYGTVQGSGSGCVQPSSTPIRETKTTYKTILPTAGSLIPTWPSLIDRQATVQVYGTGTLLSETDYAYDGGAALTCITSPIGHDDTNFGCGSTVPRGNLTMVTRKCIAGTGCTNDSVTQYTYDTTGQLATMVDPCGYTTCSDMTGTNHTTTYVYADSYTSDDGSPTGNTNAYLTKVTDPAGHITTFQYGFEDGKLRNATDENGQITTFCYWTTGCSPSTFDPFVRLTQVKYPDNGLSTFAYSDAGPTPSVTTTKAITSSLNMVTTATYDALGRPIGTALTSDPENPTYTATVVDGMGKPYKVYNPTRCSPPTTSCGEATWGFSTYTYDALGRTTSVLEQDGSTVGTAYNNNCTTATDEVGAVRVSCSDSLGRLTQVQEPGPGATAGNLGSAPLVTQYFYDGLSNLLCAVQKGTDTTQFTTCSAASSTWRPRSFAYDSLSRLSSAQNPESGKITYTYDQNGNLSTRIVPKAGQTGSMTTTHTYAYEVLNRLIKETHLNPNEGTEAYSYDGTTITGCTGTIPPTITSATNLIGRRSAMCAGPSASSWSYDSMGRPLEEARTNKGTSAKQYNFFYNYNLDGSVYQLTYPSDVITYTPGGAGRPLGVSDSVNDYVDNGLSTNPATYAPNGALMGMINGYNSSSNPVFTGIVTANTFNSRLQPAGISATAPSSGNFYSLSYNFNLGTGDNGNVFQVTNSVDSTRSTTYKYDFLNRISQAYTTNMTSSNCWGETYNPDYWGNMTAIGVPTGLGGNCVKESLAATATTLNQLSGLSMTYDAAGNVTKDNLGNTPTYDQENRISTVAGYTYSYDADGARMEKAAGSSGTMYWTGRGGEVLIETNLSGTINEQYIFFNGVRIARVDRPSGAVHYYFANNVGSHTMVTSATGLCEQDIDYFPYGGVIKDHCPNVAQHYKFTGKERDTESGLDNFGARYNASSMGRFMSPDWAAKPIAVPYAMFGDPQSLNLYSYVRNNPLAKVDADGHCPSDNPNCNNVKVETQKTDAKIVKNETIAGEPGKRTGVEASATYKITENGKALANTTVQESNDTKTTVDGKPLNIPSNHGPGSTDENGSVKDDLSLTAPAQPGANDNNLVQGMSTSAFVSTDKQVMTFKTPEGATCSATSERVLTNVGADGKPSGVYSVTAPTPVVKTVQPPNQ